MIYILIILLLASVSSHPQDLLLFVHVKSHKEDEISYKDLSLPSKINFCCDNAVKYQSLGLTGPSPLRSLPDLTSPHLHDENGRITTPFAPEM